MEGCIGMCTHAGSVVWECAHGSIGMCTQGVWYGNVHMEVWECVLRECGMGMCTWKYGIVHKGSVVWECAHGSMGMCTQGVWCGAIQGVLIGAESSYIVHVQCM